LSTGISSSHYEICDPWESSYQPGSDIDGHTGRSHEVQIELCPSTRIGCREKCFLFSGAVATHERGLTVAHAVQSGDKIVLDSKHDCSARDRTIGRCLETYGNLRQQSGERLSADLTLLELYSRKCSVDNIVRWPIPAGRTLQIKIYKGQKVPDDTRVIILDQNGDFQYGSIRRDHLTDMRLVQDHDVHNVLGICTKKGQKEVSVTQLGDSGALVMSLPSKESFLYVYGIVTGIYTEQDNKSLTVANSLWDVIHELCTNPNYHTEFFNNNIGYNVDFV